METEMLLLASITSEMSWPLILMLILGFIGVIAMFIPTKTKEGEKIKVAIWATCWILVALIVIISYIFGCTPSYDEPWSELP